MFRKFFNFKKFEINLEVFACYITKILLFILISTIILVLIRSVFNKSEDKENILLIDFLFFTILMVIIAQIVLPFIFIIMAFIILIIKFMLTISLLLGGVLKIIANYVIKHKSIYLGSIWNNLIGSVEQYSSFKVLLSFIIFFIMISYLGKFSAFIIKK